MTRNKFVLLLMAVAVAWLMTPRTGIFMVIKVNIINALPYVMAFIIIYLIITINMLKSKWKKLDQNLTDANVIDFAKMMNVTFDVKRMLGVTNLIDLYSKVNFSHKISMHAKELLYQAMRRKRLDVPVPGQGADVDEILRKAKSKDEVRAAQIEAKMRAKQKARKKKSN
ncbi:MAG: hypothetical protein IJ070_03490 [Firmicutes bacterium]|nr:hypothetical protein [Bacillota bacterium]